MEIIGQLNWSVLAGVALTLLFLITLVAYLHVSWDRQLELESKLRRTNLNQLTYAPPPKRPEPSPWWGLAHNVAYPNCEADWEHRHGEPERRRCNCLHARGVCGNLLLESNCNLCGSCCREFQHSHQ